MPHASLTYLTQFADQRGKISTRFAPSPTGHLHLGHVVNAIFVWGIAQHLGGKIILRCEDHDRGRCRQEYEQSILEDLHWLGFVPDVGLDQQRQLENDYRQSSHAQRYQDALIDLRARGAQLYYCDCSRKAIRSQPAPTIGTDAEPRYNGHCRNRRLADGNDCGVRLVLDSTPMVFNDAWLRREFTHNPAEQCGDLLLRDRDGNWTYHLAVTVDDLHDDINLVIRGMDLLTSTGRQLALRQQLSDTPPPLFAHHPLLKDKSGRKLSKRDADLGVRNLRANGKTPAAVIGEAAFLAGLQPTAKSIPADAVRSLLT